MTFDDIIGQEKAIARLKGYIDARAVDSAYLFTGPAGIGKALTARAFAKAVNCLAEGRYGCDECGCCHKIDKGAHADIHIIESADNMSVSGNPQEEAIQIRITQIRKLQEDISYRPYEGRKKVS